MQLGYLIFKYWNCNSTSGHYPNIIVDQGGVNKVRRRSFPSVMTGSKNSHLRLPRTNPSEAYMPVLVVQLPCLVPLTGPCQYIFISTAYLEQKI